MTKLQSFSIHLRKFLKSNRRNAWIGPAAIKVYVRKGVHFVNGEVYRTLDLASVEVKLKFRRQGLFKGALTTMQNFTPFAGVYVENVGPELAAYLDRLAESDPSWICDPGTTGIAPCYAWIKKEVLDGRRLQASATDCTEATVSGSEA